MTRHPPSSTYPPRGTATTATRAVLIFAAAFPTGCTGLAEADRDSIRNAVKTVLDTQVAAWNAGDLEAFMQTYWRSDGLRFASGGTLKEGWEATLERYRATYPDKAAMGRLTFDVLDIQVVARDAAVVFGAWRLQREAGELTGLYTLIVRRIDGEWLIVHDHTSRAR